MAGALLRSWPAAGGGRRGQEVVLDHRDFLDEHFRLTRRFFLRAGVLGFATALSTPDSPGKENDAAAPAQRARPDKAGALREPYFTPAEDFRDVSRGDPRPHSLPDERKRAVGLTRETWRLEVVSDPEHPALLGRQLSRADGTALDFSALLKLAEKHAVR